MIKASKNIHCVYSKPSSLSTVLLAKFTKQVH